MLIYQHYSTSNPFERITRRSYWIKIKISFKNWEGWEIPLNINTSKNTLAHYSKNLICRNKKPNIITKKLTLNGHKKFDANLNLSPTVKISWIKSSTQIISDLLNLCSMISLLVIATLCPLILAKPRLYTSSRTDLRLG